MSYSFTYQSHHYARDEEDYRDLNQTKTADNGYMGVDHLKNSLAIRWPQLQVCFSIRLSGSSRINAKHHIQSSRMDTKSHFRKSAKITYFKKLREG